MVTPILFADNPNPPTKRTIHLLCESLHYYDALYPNHEDSGEGNSERESERWKDTEKKWDLETWHLTEIIDQETTEERVCRGFGERANVCTNMVGRKYTHNKKNGWRLCSDCEKLQPRQRKK